MVQDTTKEFGRRLEQAVEAFPDAPPTPYGRVSWLQREVQNRGNTKVSVNTVHKWFNGVSRPREDKMRALARVLQVDEIWLAHGRKPVAAQKAPEDIAVEARGAVLFVAGLVEVLGGRVTFLSEDEVGNLQVNLRGSGFKATIVTAQTLTAENAMFVVPEPVGNNRIMAVVPAEDGKFLVQLYDLTHVQRSTFGGFSVIEMKRRDADAFFDPEGGDPINPVADMEAMVG